MRRANSFVASTIAVSLRSGGHISAILNLFNPLSNSRLYIFLGLGSPRIGSPDTTPASFHSLKYPLTAAGSGLALQSTLFLISLETTMQLHTFLLSPSTNCTHEFISK